MKYITVKEASKIWNISVSRIGKLIRSGKVSGVTKVGGHYLIEDGTLKPNDGRYKNEKKVESKVNFRYPNFAYQDINTFIPSLNNEELQLKMVEEEFLACNYEGANDNLSNLIEKTNNKYIKIYSLYCGLMIDIMLNNIKRFYIRYNSLILELQGNFPYKKEMSYLIHEIEAFLGYAKYFTDEFEIDTTYNYDSRFLSHLVELNTTSIYCNIMNESRQNINAIELSCKLIENSTDYSSLGLIYSYLSSIFAITKDYNKMRYYFKKALDIAEKFNCFFYVSSLYYYMKDLLRPVLVDYSIDFKKKIEYYSTDLQNRYIKFSSTISIDSIFEKVANEDYILILYAIQKYTNKEIASILNESEISIAKKYSKLYEKTKTNNKADLIDYFNKSINKSIFNNKQ